MTADCNDAVERVKIARRLLLELDEGGELDPGATLPEVLEDARRLAELVIDDG